MVLHAAAAGYKVLAYADGPPDAVVAHVVHTRNTSMLPNSACAQLRARDDALFSHASFRALAAAARAQAQASKMPVAHVAADAAVANDNGNVPLPMSDRVRTPQVASTPAAGVVLPKRSSLSRTADQSHVIHN